MDMNVVVLNELRMQTQEQSQLLRQRTETIERLEQKYDELKTKNLELTRQTNALSEQHMKLIDEDGVLEATASFLEIDHAITASQNKSKSPKKATTKKKNSGNGAKRKNQKETIAKTQKKKIAKAEKKTIAKTAKKN